MAQYLLKNWGTETLAAKKKWAFYIKRKRRMENISIQCSIFTEKSKGEEI